MAQVLELGRLGETEALFTLLLSGSLLVWHAGYAGRRRAGWIAAYVLVALATLAKGPQAPVYFVLAVGGYLLVRGRWRDALDGAHLAGVLVFLAIWAAWQAPFAMKLGWNGLMGIYGGDVALRFDDTRAGTFLRHLGSYPLEVFACMAPWSILLAAYASADFRRRLGAARDQVVFLACAVAVSFPTCWLVPGARSRYFMPLYPCFALLAGLVVQRWANWRPALPAQADSPRRLRRATIAVWAVAALMGLGYTTLVVNILAHASQASPAAAIAAIKARLPAGTKLVSFGYVDPLFAYYYGEPIRYLPWPRPGAPIDPAIEYFCFGNDSPLPGKLELPYERLGTVCCDRNRLDQPRRVVVIGRRVAAAPITLLLPRRLGMGIIEFLAGKHDFCGQPPGGWA
jgi:4-amino-4-deoxy-L-arabinose transferase-like glycosyltransferase